MPTVHVVTPDGTTGTVPEDELALMPAGTKVVGGSPSTEGDSGGLLGAVAAGVLGAGSTATLGATDKLAREIPYIIGGPKASREVTSQLRTVRERNPYSTLAGEFGGLLVNPEALSGLGEAAAAPVAARVGEGLLGQMATSAVKVGAETALMGAQHEITEESLGDHDLNAQAIWSQAAKEGLMGAAGGAVLGLGGGLLGKARAAGGGLLARRSGPLSAETLDELAGGVEGAGAGVRDHASRAERTIEGLRATGATTDQAIDAVEGLDMAAKAGSATHPIGKDVIDMGAEEYIQRVAGKNPERAEILRQHYKNALKPFEQGVSETDRSALDLVKSGNGFMRNGEDMANVEQFAMKPERFAKLVDPNRLDAQMDQVANLMQETDRVLSEWESTASKGGSEATVRSLRKQWTDVNDVIHNFTERPSESLGRDLNVAMNRFKQNVDRFIPYSRAPGSVVEGKAFRYGVPDIVSNPDFGIEQLANKVRSGLEDEAVWGEAGSAQARENLSFSDRFERHKDFVDTFGVVKDQSQGVRIPEIDYSKTRGVLDKVTGNPEIDEALQPIKSARAAIDRQRNRIAALRESGELSESTVAKFAQAEKDVNAFESSLNGAMKRAAIENRLRSAVLEEGHSGIGGLVGAGLDTVNRPFKTLERMAQIKHTKDRVVGTVKRGLEEFAEKGGSTSTDGIVGRDVTPRPRPEIIKDIERTRELAGNPAALESAVSRMVGDLHGYAPQTANALRLTAMRYLMYLSYQSPIPSVSSTSGFGKPEARYSDIAVHEWEAKRIAAADPRDMLVDMRHGKLDRDSIEAARFVAPRLYREMQAMAQEQLDRAKARGDLDKWPYQQQALMASLLDVSADDTFKPDFMLAMKAARELSASAAPPPQQGGSPRAPSGPAKPPAWLSTQAQQIEAGGM